MDRTLVPHPSAATCKSIASGPQNSVFATDFQGLQAETASMEVFMSEKDSTEGAHIICRPFITLKNGKKIFAAHHGLKAFCFEVKDDPRQPRLTGV
jgi:hypothetical protein